MARTRRTRLDDPSLWPIVRDLKRAREEWTAAETRLNAARARRRAAVQAARDAGATWEEIAALVGASDRRTAEAILREPERRARRAK